MVLQPSEADMSQHQDSMELTQEHLLGQLHLPQATMVVVPQRVHRLVPDPMSL